MPRSWRWFSLLRKPIIRVLMVSFRGIAEVYGGS